MTDVSERVLIGKLRRINLLARQPEYVSSQLKLRGGSCSRCGACCKLLFDCPFLSGSGCTSYESRSDVCRAFPINQDDIDDVVATGGRCGFWFPAPVSIGASDSTLPVVGSTKINEAIVDRWTAVHIASGVASSIAGAPFWLVVVGSLVFEVFENLLQPKFSSIFANTADRDSPMNSSCDTLGVLLGWWIGQGIKK